MIRLRIFCPFERISSFLYNKAKAAKAVKYVIRFDGFGERTVPIDNLGPNRNLGFSVQDRDRFLSSEEQTGSVDFIFENGEVVRRPIQVKHILLTDYPVVKAFSFDGKDNLTNGDIAGNKVGYVEAAPYILNSNQVSDVQNPQLVKNGQVLRPFYGYISDVQYDNQNNKVYVFYGPAAPDESATSFAKVRTNGLDITLFKKGKYVPITPERKETPIIGTSNLQVFFKIEGQLVRFTLSQLQPNYDGRLICMRDLLLSLYLACYVESMPGLGFNPEQVAGFDAKANTLTLDLVKKGNSYGLSSVHESDYYKYCSNNVRLQFMDFLSATDTTMFIRKKVAGVERVGYLVDKESTSCFALCFAFILASISGASYTDFVLALKYCIENDVFEILENGKIKGNTSVFMKQPGQFELPSLTGGVSFALTRKDLKEIPFNEKQGLAILGFDPTTANVQKGVPDHYVVVFVDGNTQTLSLIYDPLQFIYPGTVKDMSGYLRPDDDSWLTTFSVSGREVASINGNLVYNT